MLTLAPISLFHTMKEIPGYRHIQKLSSPGKKTKMEVRRGYNQQLVPKEFRACLVSSCSPSSDLVCLNWTGAEAILECLKQKASGVLLKIDLLYKL